MSRHSCPPGFRPFTPAGGGTGCRRDLRAGQAQAAGGEAAGIFGSIGRVLTGAVRLGADVLTDIIPGQVDDVIADAILGGGGADPATGGFGCLPGFTRTPGGQCIPDDRRAITAEIPGSPGIITPAERSIGAVTGFIAPSLTPRLTAVCPRIGGKGSVLHINPFTGQEVCLPRGVSGSAFGLVRKWAKPKTETQMFAKKLRAAESIKAKTKKLAIASGWKCTGKR